MAFSGRWSPATVDQLLGFPAVETEAGELVAVVQTAMLAGLPYTALRDRLLTHPTMAEGLAVLFPDAPQTAGSRQEKSR